MAIIALASYCGFGVAFIMTATAMILNKLRSQKQLIKEFGPTIYYIDVLARLLASVAGVLYYIGDNISGLMAQYGVHYGCGVECQDFATGTGKVCEVAAILGFMMTPLLIDKAKAIADLFYSPKQMPWQWSLWKNTTHIMAMIIDFDAWFSTVSDLLTLSSKYCPIYQVVSDWLLYVFSLGLFTILIAFTLMPALYKARVGASRRNALPASLCAAIFILGATLLLADNDQPVGCLFDCDVASNNGTLGHTCDAVANGVIRMVLLSVDLMIVITIVAMLLLRLALEQMMTDGIVTPQLN